MRASAHKALSDLLMELAPYCELQHWRFILSQDPTTEDGAAATCYPIDGRKLAIITLAADTHTVDRRTILHYLLHELTHCTLRDFSDVVAKMAVPHMAPQAGAVLSAAADNVIEHVTDTVAFALGDLIVLAKPNFPTLDRVVEVLAEGDIFGPEPEPKPVEPKGKKK